MTAQISDKFFYNEKNYNLVAISKALNFKPEDYGMTPQAITTACWRGFYCEYVIQEGFLYLNKFTVFSSNGNYPEINGKKPVPVSHYAARAKEKNEVYDGPYEYIDLKLPIDFTGKIVLGDCFLPEYYLHMGFQRAWAYEELIEIVLDGGIVIDVINHSEKAKALRARIHGNKKGFDEALKDDIPRFVVDSFSLELKDKAWWIDE